MAETPATAHPWRPSRRDRGGFSRVDGDGRRAVAFPGTEADRASPETRRALVPAASLELSQDGQQLGTSSPSAPSNTKGPVSRAFLVAGAGFEPATSGL